MINPFTKQEHPQELNPNPSNSFIFLLETSPIGFINVKKVKNEPERQNLLKQPKLSKKRFIRKDKSKISELKIIN